MQAIKRIIFFTIVSLLLPASLLPAGEKLQVDVLIYSGSPAGIAAATEAAREGTPVLIVEPYQWIGGLMTNGLSHADFRTFEGFTGSYLEFTQRVQKHYEDTFGKDSAESKSCFRGTQAEPKVNRKIFEDWLAEFPSIQIRTGWRLTSVSTHHSNWKISACTFINDQGEELVVDAQVYIDASYEGDLLAKTTNIGTGYAVGQEARSQYNESIAPEQADQRVQGYNFRLTVTDDPANQIETPKPIGYQRDDFLPLLNLIENGTVDKPFCNDSGDRKALFKAHNPPLPHRKYDVNDVSQGAVRLSLPQINNAWPEGEEVTRQQLFADHVRHQVGLLYFVQNDVAVPQAFREQANAYKLCKDEFTTTNGLPEQLYIREARRMIGKYVFTQNDVLCVEGDARSKFQPDSIAMCDYGPNCHGTDHTGPHIGGKHTGEFYVKCPPYQIPLGVIQSKEYHDLLVPTACSSSHVGFCALRLEPIWMSLGQAAGVAARMSITHNMLPANVAAKDIQAQLHKQKAATTYISDFREDHPDFEAVQWWASLGGFHNDQTGDLPACGTRGENITGQYYEAYPNHAARLDENLTTETFDRWTKISLKSNITPHTSPSITRRDFIQHVYRIYLRQVAVGE